MIIGNKEFDFNNDIYIMGILNVTPDSFSDGGKYNNIDVAVKHAIEMQQNGADIIDIGGESTRPGFSAVDESEEIERVVPVIEAIRKATDIPISIDTTKAEVARQAVIAGADIINDVSGFLLDNNMYGVAAKLDAPCVLMHDGNYFTENIVGDNESESTTDYIGKLKRELVYIAEKAVGSGINPHNIILDPGVGFGKTLNENLLIVKHMDEFKELGYPVLLGCSRKSLIGLSLDLPVNERVEGTLVTSIMGAMYGASILRVHDVKENVRAVRMLKAVIGAKEQ